MALLTTMPTSMIMPIREKIEMLTPAISMAGTTPIIAMGTVNRMTAA